MHDRSVNDAKMQQFFRNNFSEERWRKAALKNAFALLGRQRFQHAAGFFLLAGAVRDAIEVRSWVICTCALKIEFKVQSMSNPLSYFIFYV